MNAVNLIFFAWFAESSEIDVRRLALIGEEGEEILAAFL
jgi:hypothetical protein